MRGTIFPFHLFFNASGSTHHCDLTSNYVHMPHNYIWFDPDEETVSGTSTIRSLESSACHYNTLWWKKDSWGSFDLIQRFSFICFIRRLRRLSIKRMVFSTKKTLNFLLALKVCQLESALPMHAMNGRSFLFLNFRLSFHHEIWRWIAYSYCYLHIKCWAKGVNMVKD